VVKNTVTFYIVPSTCYIKRKKTEGGDTGSGPERQFRPQKKAPRASSNIIPLRVEKWKRDKEGRGCSNSHRIKNS
jgi:hypothetical protein